jgi:ribosomal protein RSM22 (predicted rRNA methylase)
VFRRVLNELKIRNSKFAPMKVLDFGSGLGSFSWAATDVFKSIKQTAAVEPNSMMRKLGKFMTKDVEPEILWVDALSMIPGLGGTRGQFDLVMMGNVLTEIPTPSA